MSKRYGSIEERFWRETWPEPNSGCWLWAGSIDDCGYGRFRVGAKKKRLHVLSYEMYCGPVPDGLILRHTCDVACCVNPDHLVPGTHADNVGDMDRRGRRSRGERHNAKLTNEQVIAIRNDPRTHRALGAIYGVAHTIIGNIKRGEDWSHL